MNTTSRLAVVALFALLGTGIGGGLALAQAPPPPPVERRPEPPRPETKEAPPPRPEPQPQTTAGTAPVYKPPLRGAPRGRVGGGTRGGEESGSVFVAVLAPDHLGLTAADEVSLYWFLSAPTPAPIELTFTEARATHPILELRLPAAAAPGFHRFRLADHGIRLIPGVSYRWFVAIVLDAERRSKDILAGGMIERLARPPELSARVGEVRSEDLPALYAELGLWYDAVSAVSALIEAAPEDVGLREHRAALLEHAELHDVAAADRRRMR